MVFTGDGELGFDSGEGAFPEKLSTNDQHNRENTSNLNAIKQHGELARPSSRGASCQTHQLVCRVCAGGGR